MCIRLWCKEIALYDTPAQIADSCYFRDNTDNTPANWKVIRDRYIAWVINSNPSDDATAIKYHCQSLLSFKKLTFDIV